MKELKLPRLISDGMVLQQKKKVRIWGVDEPGRKVMLSFLGEEYVTGTDAEGNWEIFLEGLIPGGPYSMYFSDDTGCEKVVDNVLIGDVWLCSGQSNMELPMARVKDKYPEDVERCKSNYVRTFKITENGEFHGPLSELQTGEWKTAGKDTILDFSATGYFFARQMYCITGVPVGFINVSLGGSRIESWMGRDMLEGYDELLALADKYADDDFIKERLLTNQRQCEEWHGRLDSMDTGLKEGWERENTNTSLWKEVNLPFFFKDTELKGFIGSVWFRKEFSVPEGLVEKEAKIWLGTIVDSDTVYINGIMVGHTDYQYPPRKYVIPEGLLKKEHNTVTIRVKCENGQGRFTPGKLYTIFNDEETVDLTGVWKYRIGTSCEQIKETDFVNWKPTGLYNGMTAPCHKYTIAGIVWYQGEANWCTAESYLDLTRRLIKGYREKWGDETLPFLYVQLPNFSGEIYDIDRDGVGSQWAEIREKQRQALEIPGTGMVVAIDLGEDNDLHPLNKRDIGFRLAMHAASRLYDLKVECQGPQVDSISAEIVKEKADREKTLCRAVLTCRYAGGGMYAFSPDKGKEIADFEMTDEKGNCHQAQAEIQENKIILTCRGLDALPVQIRYCYSNTNKGALIYNKAGFPMSPFCVSLEGQDKLHK